MARLAVIGSGIMGGLHAQEIATRKGVSIAACCDIDPNRSRAFAEKWGIPRWYVEYEELLDKENVDGVINATIDIMHMPVALAVLKRKIPVLSEKPMADTLANARNMFDAAKKASVPAMVNFTYRNAPCLQAAAHYIREGGIGRVMHVEASYLQSWLAQAAWGDWRTDPAWTWRLSTKHGSSGVLGDLGCHIYDLATFLCGDLESIDCRLKTFDKGVPKNRLGPYILDANDSFISTVSFSDGAMGTIHASRWATGHMNTLRARIHGDKGAIEVDLDRSREHYSAVTGDKALVQAEWKTVACKATPTNLQRFLGAIRTGRNDVCDFANGLKIQAYLHGSAESDRIKSTVRISDLLASKKKTKR